jgi:hypothetical protein
VGKSTDAKRRLPNLRDSSQYAYTMPNRPSFTRTQRETSNPRVGESPALVRMSSDSC